MTESWPNPRIDYDRPSDTAANTQVWQSALDSALEAGTLQWENTHDKDIFRLTGQCPRCGHDTATTVEVEYFRGIDETSWMVPFNFRCKCGKPGMHAAPDDIVHDGCGWGGPVEVTSEIPASLQ